jgi:hypothetical protein
MNEPKFPKEKILTFKRFAGRRDLLSVLLEDGKEYTLAQAEEAMQVERWTMRRLIFSITPFTIRFMDVPLSQSCMSVRAGCPPSRIAWRPSGG